MANEPKMKIPIEADSSDFDKGARKVKQEMKDLNKVSSDAFAAIGSAIGVDTGKLAQFSSAIQGLGNQFAQMGSKGAQAFGSVLKAIGPVATGIAGLGIGAAVTAFKALKSEADNFANTIDGLNLKMGTQAYIETYRQALHDANADTGKSVGEAMANWQKGWERFKSNVGATFVQWIAGEDTVGLAEAWSKVSAAAKDAEAAAERNEVRGSKMADILKEELEVRKQVADIEVQIAEQRRILRDRSEDDAVRAAAEAKVRELINTKISLQTNIAEQLYTLTQEMADEANNTKEDTEKTVAAYERWKGLLASSQDQLAQIDRYSNSIKKNTEAEFQYRLRIQNMMKSGGGIQSVESGPIINNQLQGVQIPVNPVLPLDKIHEFKEHWVTELGGGLTLAIAIDPDSVDKIHDITREIQSAIENLAESVGESIGNMVGALISGQDPWQAFANTALSAIGDMAVSVGKMAVATGVATLGIKAALESLNGYVAIAAGIALIALGTAVKSGLAGIANGNYSANTNVASSGSYSSNMNNYEQRDIYVNVQGVLRADGNQLLAVINNTEKKNKVTT